MGYKGKISSSGNSQVIRLDKNLFRQHPEFKQQANVRADVIGPGTMLLQVIDDAETDITNDLMVSAFLSFIEQDAISNPANLTPVSAEQMAQVADLIAGVIVTDDDELD